MGDDLVKLDDVSIVDPNEPLGDPKKYALEEKSDLEDQRKQLELTEYAGNIKQREKYARYIFWLLACWMTAVLGIVTTDGFGFRGFDVADSVLLALIGSTTANVIGIFAIVANYFFPKK